MILFSFLSKLQVKKEQVTCFFVKKNKNYTCFFLKKNVKYFSGLTALVGTNFIRDFTTYSFT
ncbi:hypothetical protein BD770DRAFT_391490, partial [Pilaira anomala]